LTKYPAIFSQKLLSATILSVLSTSAWATSALSIPAAQTHNLFSLGDLAGGVFFSYARAVNSDGSVVVGYSNSTNGNEAFRWTEADGMVGLGDLDGGSYYSYAHGVNSDGSVVVGYSGSANGPEAFRWTGADGIVGLGDLDGGSYYSMANGVNSDGSVVVGYSGSANGPEAFRWTEADGMVGLGDLDGGSFFSYAHGVNSDGSVVVGYSGSANGNEAFRWTEAGGMVGLGDLAGGSIYSEATDVNSDGSVVVGYSGSANGTEAFRWTEADGMLGLGDLAGGSFFSYAHGVNSDGSVVVGDSVSANGTEAFRWTQASGMVSVLDWLRAGGVAVDENISLSNAHAVSDDGNTVVGKGDFGNGGSEAFVARLGGLITIEELSSSLNSNGLAVSAALRAGNTVIHGAHSRPLARRVAPGLKTVWIAGDWGRDTHGSNDGEIGLAEIGIGHNLGRVQMNIALGKTWANHNLLEHGEIDSDGQYVMLEGIMPITAVKGLYAVIGGFYQQGEADIQRGYLNAGNYDASSASPDVSTFSLRARLEWENALAFQATHISPYIDATYARTRMDGYTETGGGFPAQFDSRQDETAELRLGANAALDLSFIPATLISNLEAAHRFNDNGAGSTGQVIGLSSFDLNGQQFDQSWLKAGVGLEGKVAGGKAYIMLNGTTEGEVASAWLAVSYQQVF